MKQLTKKQIERQDFVDNQIFELIQKLLPPAKQTEWNIEEIGEVRDTIQRQIVDNQKATSETKFYP
jgi:hypothetical protein